jgi:hypothetical protein
MKYRVLDDITYYEPSKSGNKPKTAHAGDVVELSEKDAAALVKRGSVVPLQE